MISFVIDGQSVEAKEDGNVLEAALDAGIEIPHLCYNESVKPYGACRLCLVEVVRKGKSRMTTACTHPVLEGMEVLTRTEKVLRARRMILELILAMCPGDSLIQKMAKEMGVEEVRFKKGDKERITLLSNNPGISHSRGRATMDYLLLTLAFLGEIRDFLAFHSLLIKGIIGGIVFFWVLDKA